ncbi:MAG: hypothetical protein Q9207_008059 [Kuettlingeria erythrocarpa]
MRVSDTSTFTKAAKGSTGEDVNCAICHDSLAGPDEGLPDLFMTRLPDCGHVFHEICLIQWLSPITLPPTEKIKVEYPTSATTSNSPYAPSSRPQDIPLSGLGEYDPHAVRQPPDVLIDGVRALERRREARLRLQTIRDAESPNDNSEDGELSEDDDLDSEGTEMDDHPFSYSDQPWLNLEPQQLPPITMVDEDPDINNYDLSRRSKRFGAQSYRCPLCREPAFKSSSPCHFDSLRLLRVRCRITDLAYELFNFERDEREEEDRRDLVQFLHRRYLDNVALGERETLPSPSDARDMFRQARWELRQRAYQYMLTHTLAATEQLRIVQLATVFENFPLKDTDIPFMFHPIPKRIPEICMTLDDVWKLNTDPRSFLSELEFPNVVEAATANSPSNTDEDADMADAVDDEDLIELDYTDEDHVEANDGDISDDVESEDNVS